MEEVDGGGAGLGELDVGPGVGPWLPVQRHELPHCARPHGKQEPVSVQCTPVQSPPRRVAPLNGRSIP